MKLKHSRFALSALCARLGAAGPAGCGTPPPIGVDVISESEADATAEAAAPSPPTETIDLPLPSPGLMLIWDGAKEVPASTAMNESTFANCRGEASFQFKLQP